MPARARWCARDQIAWLSPFPPAATALSAPTHQQIIFLFNHLVRSGEQRWRNFEAERLRRRQIHNELKVGRLLDWNVGGLYPAQNSFFERGGNWGASEAFTLAPGPRKAGADSLRNHGPLEL